MSRSKCFALFGYLFLYGALFRPQPGSASQWRVADCPLITPWANQVNPDETLPEYPRPQMVRMSWKNLNGLWQFQAADEGDTVPVGKKLKDQILVPFPWESALSGVHKFIPSYRAWYRRSFEVPSQWEGNRVLLHFGAVDWESHVYVNGTCVGTHKGGYDPFSYDVTTHLKPGAAQELIVFVYDPGNARKIAKGKQANDRFDDPQRYSYCTSSGIWQTVWLEAVPQTYVEDMHIVPDVDNRQVSITLSLSGKQAGVAIEAIVKDGQREIGRASANPNQILRVSISEPKLWSPSKPFLYDLELSLKKDGKAIDSVKSYFGMRKVSLGKHNGITKILLNNKFIFQMGPLDQGYWPDGIYTAPTDEALRWDVERMKAFGYNMVRKHVKVEPARWYYWCDKLGLIVWQDMPHAFGDRTEAEKMQFELELQRMVRTHWNHPSIIQWIVFNEHWGLYDPERLTTSVMQLDPSRLVTCNSGIDAGNPDLDFEVGHIKDNHHYRPPTCPYASNSRAIVNGEYGAIGYKIEGHIWDIDGPWVHHNYKGKDEATTEYEQFIKQILGFKKNGGLSAAVYTQWTDVENEMNGIYTYDRKIIKLHKDRVTAANLSTYKDDLTQ